MRRCLSLALLACTLHGVGCDTPPRDEIFPCDVDSDCPEGNVCVEGGCVYAQARRPTPDGGGDDAGRVASPADAAAPAPDAAPPPDAARPPDAVLPAADAAPPLADAEPPLSDAGPIQPDAAPTPPDAALSRPDAAPTPPDAAADSPDAVPCQPGPERCNGLDDDCDGAADETFPRLGDACSDGQGGCTRDGLWRCTEDGDAAQCDAVAGAPVPETCNRVDDDCDGITDEDLGLGVACAAGLGICRAGGVVACDPDGAARCNAVPRPAAAETCDGRDEDCDGQADEDFGVDEACTVGVGVCAAPGLRICAAGDPGASVCDAAASAPLEELCNGLDDDCDGETDEALRDEPVWRGADALVVEGCGDAMTEAQRLDLADCAPTRLRWSARCPGCDPEAGAAYTVSVDGLAAGGPRFATSALTADSVCLGARGVAGGTPTLTFRFTECPPMPVDLQITDLVVERADPSICPLLGLPRADNGGFDSALAGWTPGVRGAGAGAELDTDPEDAANAVGRLSLPAGVCGTASLRTAISVPDVEPGPDAPGWAIEWRATGAPADRLAVSVVGSEAVFQGDAVGSAWSDHRICVPPEDVGTVVDVTFSADGSGSCALLAEAEYRIDDLRAVPTERCPASPGGLLGTNGDFRFDLDGWARSSWTADPLPEAPASRAARRTSPGGVCETGYLRGRVQVPAPDAGGVALVVRARGTPVDRLTVRIGDAPAVPLAVPPDELEALRVCIDPALHGALVDVEFALSNLGACAAQVAADYWVDGVMLEVDDGCGPP